MQSSVILRGMVLVVGLAVATACTSDPSSADAMRSLKTSEVAPQPDAKMAARSGKSLDSIGNGYSIFQRKCLECHEARVPKNPSNPNWHPTMVGMSWNAGLSESEQSDMMAYIAAAAQ